MATERQALGVSIGGSAFMALVGVGFALGTGSGAILLDGIFSGLGVLMAIVTLRVAALQERPRDERFQYGYAPFIPFVNTVRAALFVGLSAFAVVSAAQAIREGGREMAAGWGALYGVVASAGCLGLAVWTRGQAARLRSPLLEVDAKGWLIDGALSVVVAVAFGTALLLEGSDVAPALPYVDPGLVILLVALVLPMPLRILLRSVEQLLLVAPPADTQERVRNRWREATVNEPFRRSVLSMVRVGRALYVTAHVVVDPDRAGGVAELDDRRARIAETLAGADPDLVLDILFTADERWLP
jgi:predicted Co/Zn/Cd cation transporter (cation efflux family)